MGVQQSQLEVLCDFIAMLWRRIAHLHRRLCHNLSVEQGLDIKGFWVCTCRTLTCKDGRFAMTHMNNWQHASVYPGFLLAAVLDWVAMAVPLPPGMQQVSLQDYEVVDHI